METHSERLATEIKQQSTGESDLEATPQEWLSWYSSRFIDVNMGLSPLSDEAIVFLHLPKVYFRQSWTDLDQKFTEFFAARQSF
jgi:hypothetical protein